MKIRIDGELVHNIKRIDISLPAKKSDTHMFVITVNKFDEKMVNTYDCNHVCIIDDPQ